MDYDGMRSTIESCRGHINSLENQQLADQQAEKERLQKQRLEEERARKMAHLQSYLTELQAKLDQARDQILSRVSIAIQFEAPQTAAQDAQKCINDLESIRASANRLGGELAKGQQIIIKFQNHNEESYLKFYIYKRF
jgi:DNA repair exonuclease SbcCD ATPase subunit